MSKGKGPLFNIQKLDNNPSSAKNNYDWQSVMKTLFPRVKLNTISKQMNPKGSDRNYLMQVVTIMPTRKNVIKKVLTACPDMANKTDSKGRTALHHAALYEASAGVMKVLIDANPNAVPLADKEGNTPIHLALKCKRFEMEPLKELWNDCPGIMLMQDADSQTPLELSQRNKAPKELTKALLEATQFAIETIGAIEKAKTAKAFIPEQNSTNPEEDPAEDSSGKKQSNEKANSSKEDPVKDQSGKNQSKEKAEQEKSK